MKVIFAQGNPGAEYYATRHNVGWYFIDQYAKQADVKFVMKSKFRALVAECVVDDEKILLVKPTTFYNDTGLCAHAIAEFYKIKPDNFLIIHDELALPLGTIRTRCGGSDAGNNGIKSLNAHLGPKTARLRVGIFDATLPRSALSSVLGTFTASELALLEQLTPSVMSVIDTFVDETFETTTHVIQPHLS